MDTTGGNYITNHKLTGAYTDPLTDTFYLEVRVFLEGVQVPYADCSVSYGIGTPASCTLVIPANSFLRDLPGTTKITVVHKDLLPDESGEYKWRLLFDGELSAYSYTIDPSGAYIQINGIHCAAYLTLMQIMCQEVRDYIVDNSNAQLGSSACLLQQKGFNTVQVQLLGAIYKDKGKKGYIKSMADVTYILLKYFLDECVEYTSALKESSASVWYKSKLGDVVGGYKILKRIYGVSDSAKSSGKLGDYRSQYDGATDGDNSASSGAGKETLALSGSAVDPKSIYDYLRGNGYSCIAACAIMGNIAQESGFIPNQGAQLETLAYGLLQWHPSSNRRQALEDYANKNGLDKSNWRTQMQFMELELSSSESLAGYDTGKQVCATLMGAGTSVSRLKDMTSYFMKNYENPGSASDGNLERRVRFANSFHARYCAEENAEAPCKPITVFSGTCHGEAPIDEEFALQVAYFNYWIYTNKDTAGMTLECTSDYRSPAYNSSINGASGSHHMDNPCTAMDLVPSAGKSWGANKAAIVEKASQYFRYASGDYPAHIHVDGLKNGRAVPIT